MTIEYSFDPVTYRLCGLYRTQLKFKDEHVEIMDYPLVRCVIAEPIYDKMGNRLYALEKLEIRKILEEDYGRYINKG
jgi:hypothetical protein